jgi:hypothetical protein
MTLSDEPVRIKRYANGRFSGPPAVVVSHARTDDTIARSKPTQLILVRACHG